MMSRPRTTSTAVFAVPTTGTAVNAVSAMPRSHPLRRMAAPTVTSASAAPRKGMERPNRLESRAPPHRVTDLVSVITPTVSKGCSVFW